MVPIRLMAVMEMMQLPAMLGMTPLLAEQGMISLMGMPAQIHLFLLKVAVLTPSMISKRVGIKLI